MEQDLFPPDELIQAAENDIDAAVMLDRAGFLVRPDESGKDYSERVAAVKRRGMDFFQGFDPDGRKEIYPGFSVNLNDRISGEIMEEAVERTEKLYGFSARWVPGFFPEKEFGPFWGGCAFWEEDDPVPVIVIRKNFIGRKKWFIYDRAELISHEMCHAARMPLMDSALEEHFAYAVSEKFLRRAIGNCFQKDTDAIFFVVPAILLALVQTLITVFQLTWLPIFPFWILALIWPVYLLTRNIFQTGNYNAALRNLKKAGFERPNAILFRSTYPEIRIMADAKPEEIRNLLNCFAGNELRWKVILRSQSPVQEKIGNPAELND